MSINVNVTYTCFRAGCDATGSVALDELLHDEEGEPRSFAGMRDFAPEGWAWETSGLEDVLHCPDHVAGAIKPGERREFQLSETHHEELLEACKPVPYIVMGGVGPRSPQENANDAWRRLGRELGFDWQTVKPVPGKGTEFFTAVTT